MESYNVEILQASGFHFLAKIWVTPRKRYIVMYHNSRYNRFAHTLAHGLCYTELIN
jgi:hypothetical protein